MATTWCYNRLPTRPMSGDTLQSVLIRLQYTLIKVIILQLLLWVRGSIHATSKLIILDVMKMLVEIANGVSLCRQLKLTQRQLTLSLPLLRNMVASISVMSCLVMCGSVVDKATWESLYRVYVKIR